MSTRSDTLHRLLRQGPVTVRQLVEKLGISQPTVSRALTACGDDIIRIGCGRAIQYALRDSTRGFKCAPIYRVTDTGKIKPPGNLIPVYPDGFVMQPTDGVSQHSDAIPWWLFDMRPQGYLGRAYASAYADTLGLPTNPDKWDDTSVIRALLAHGHDAIGNLLVGERARDNFVAMPEPVPAERETAFPRLARAAGTGELPGSSAGGEQPKFCAYTARGHVLVKFTAVSDNPVSERWRDLLLAEHLALKALGVETQIFDFDHQRFLEIPRFDRVGPLGRKAVISLRALDAEFVGGGSASWPALVTRLVDEKCVTPDAAWRSALLWAFGRLIGNTDMHTGNLSFISHHHGGPYELAPAYDILPMGFAPKTSGDMASTLRPASLPENIDADIWHEALALAQIFLEEIRRSDRFSASFAPCIEALRHHIDEAAVRIARLG
ncbi:type II toxin-antitoxin system HipA family toxin YjjJ [Shimwellia blattae]|nr:type II toxin-antitoxin system HipA family toxin YjjJ [Shimwellia blattae]GAB80535.1 putative kinase YjjJ [Shimwellia blattae DSM 4481 = NBRC 105725]VDY62835.1 putative DNA-binding transcriptional regulator [Shimwellia blattae]VEC19724.1 putative DNA-binding transcriptional regulator [Shimwellia blattae]